MPKLFRALAIAACCAVPLSAAAGAPPPLQRPVKPWNLDYGMTACMAIAIYGTPDKPITFAIRPSPNGTVVRLTVLRPGQAGKAFQFELTTNLGGASTRTNGLHFSSTVQKANTIWINVPRDDLEALRKTGEIDLDGGPLHYRLALPSMAAVLDGLDKCNADLRQYWNVGAPAEQFSRKAHSLKPLAAYFSDADYPDQANSANQGGTSKVMLMIDETGALKDCMVEVTSGFATLDAMTCGVLLERARFEPALDPAGRPTRSVITQGATWRIGR
jgi:Gram-negative bacterial TonB protein C-terminal